MKKKVLLLIVLFVFSFITMVTGLWLILDKTVVSMLVFIILMVILFFYYSYCIREITLPEGYTILQALLFYRKCVKLGIDSYSSDVKKYKLLKRISKEKNIFISMDEKKLWKLFFDGKEIDFIISHRKK